MKRLLYLLLLLLAPMAASAMHIAEGFLPLKWVIVWWVMYLPFLYTGIKRVKAITSDVPSARLLLAVVGAFVFILSSLKLPSVAGSSSHLTGIALGAILFGASTMSVIGFIALLFQSILLAHGGLTTLGANAFSMSVVGAFVAIGVFKAFQALSSPQWLSIFVAAFLSDLMIYICTSGQLAIAFQSTESSVMDNMIKFMSIYAITQLPLAIIEGIFTVFAYRLIYKYSWSEIKLINPEIGND